MSKNLTAWLLVLCILCLLFGLANHYYRHEVRATQVAVKTEPPPPPSPIGPRPRPI